MSSLIVSVPCLPTSLVKGDHIRVAAGPATMDKRDERVVSVKDVPERGDHAGPWVRVNTVDAEKVRRSHYFEVSRGSAEQRYAHKVITVDDVLPSERRTFSHVDAPAGVLLEDEGGDLAYRCDDVGVWLRIHGTWNGASQFWRWSDETNTHTWKL